MVGTLLTYVWRLQDLFPVLSKFYLPTLMSLAALVFFVMSPAPRRLGKASRWAVMRFAFCICALVLLSIPTSLYPGYSFSFFFKDYGRTFLLMLCIAAGVRSQVDLERLIITLLIGGLIYSVMIITTIPIGIDGRLGALIYYDANDLALLLACCVPLWIALLRRPERWLRLLAAVSLGVLMLTMVKTGSRGGFLGLIAAGLFMLFGFTTVSKKTRIAAVGAVVIVFVLVANDTYWHMMASLLNPSSDYNWSGNSDTGRMEIWKRGMGYMFSHPLTGVGARAFPVAEGELSIAAQLQEVGIGMKWSAAHNSFVEIGAELGVGGLICFVGMLIAAFAALRSTVRACRRLGPAGRRPAEVAQALMGTLVAFCVSGFFLSQAYSAFLYTTVGLVVALARVVPNATSGAPPSGAASRWRGYSPPGSRSSRPGR